MPNTFDREELLAQVDGDLEFLAETVQMLADDGPRLMADVSAALAAGDAPAVGRAAHTLKGMIGNFCAAEVQASALAVEQAGKAGELAVAASAVDMLALQLGDLIAELVAFIDSRA